MVLPRPTPPCKYTPRLCPCCPASFTYSAVASPSRRSRSVCNAETARACWQSPPMICPARTRRSNSSCGPTDPGSTSTVSTEELGDASAFGVASACASRLEDASDAETTPQRPNDDTRRRLQIIDDSPPPPASGRARLAALRHQNFLFRETRRKKIDRRRRDSCLFGSANRNGKSKLARFLRIMKLKLPVNLVLRLTTVTSAPPSSLLHRPFTWSKVSWLSSSRPRPARSTSTGPRASNT